MSTKKKNIRLSEIDIKTCFIDDTAGYWDGFLERRNGLGAAPVYADPDSASDTLRNYHQALWSRKLPNGEVMELKKGKKSDYLSWNGMRFASDSIFTQHRYIKCEKVIGQVKEKMYDYNFNPLWQTIKRSEEFFKLFVDFSGYVEFFFLQDFLDEKGNVIRFINDYMDENGLFTKKYPVPQTAEEYLKNIETQKEIIAKRNKRIEEYICKKNIE